MREAHGSTCLIPTTKIHECTLKRPPHIIPIHPASSRLYRIMCALKMSMLLNTNSKESKAYFRNKTNMMAEQKRQLKTAAWYVIHPFSKLAYILDCIFVCNWFGTYTLLPLYTVMARREWSSALLVCRCIMKILETMLIISFFMRGYVDKKKDIVLSAKKIAFRYLTSYFLIDFNVLFVDFILLSGNEEEGHKRNQWLWITMDILVHMSLIMRARSYLRLVDALIERSMVSRLKKMLIFHAYFCVQVLHMLSVYNILVTKSAARDLGGIPEESWMPKVLTKNQMDHLYYLYLQSFWIVACFFFGAAFIKASIDFWPEQLMLILISFLGRLYTLFVIAGVLQSFWNAVEPETRYDEFIITVNEYMIAKDLPLDIRRRMLQQYEGKLQKKAFKINRLMESLSERLRGEIFLHFGVRLVKNSPVLKQLPPSTLGVLMAQMKAETFLADDVIVGKPNDYIYFISSGTVGVFNRNYDELDHLEDGYDFGLDQGQTFLYVALEISEIYYIKLKALKAIVAQVHDLWQNYEKRFSLLRKKYEELGKRLSEGGKSVMDELKTGELLELPTRRYRE